MEIQTIIRQRYSARSYQDTAITGQIQDELQAFLASLRTGPLGSGMRLGLFAASEQDRSSLRGLGTYGFIRNPAGFIIGAVRSGEHALEDYGYVMEQAILEATRLGLGTCWLGGSFTKSSFAGKIQKGEDEILPAVTATGYPAPEARKRDVFRRAARSDTRLPWQKLFFDDNFDTALTPENAVSFRQALEMVRIAPSASNRQPWRIVRQGQSWHFYCQRTPGYGKGSLVFNLLGLVDLQRLDVGIAMCHFDLTNRELGLGGHWAVEDPGLGLPDKKTIYIATWESKTSVLPSVASEDTR
jgi:nitroreductase